MSNKIDRKIYEIARKNLSKARPFLFGRAFDSAFFFRCFKEICF